MSDIYYFGNKNKTFGESKYKISYGNVCVHVCVCVFVKETVRKIIVCIMCVWYNVEP